MQEGIAAHRADLTRRRRSPAAGAPASSSSSVRASWSGVPNIASPRPLHVKTSAPAGMPPPSASRRRPSASRRSRSAETASRACRRTTVPAWTARADGQRARLGVGADHPAHEEVALLVLGLAAVDDDPEQQPAGHERLLMRVEALDRLAQRVERGPARELADDVALGRGDGQLGPDGRRALRHARHDLDAREGEADGAVAAQLVAEEEGGVAVQRARAGDPAEHRHARSAAARARRARDRSGTSRDRAAGRRRSPPRGRAARRRRSSRRPG